MWYERAPVAQASSMARRWSSSLAPVRAAPSRSIAPRQYVACSPWRRTPIDPRGRDAVAAGQQDAARRPEVTSDERELPRRVTAARTPAGERQRLVLLS